ncbi:MAG: DUF4870 domain-containing protein [Terriglobales bacterium]
MQKPVPQARPAASPFAENIAGAIAYLTFIPAIVLLAVGPYKKNRFVRFHAVQCLLLWGAGMVVALALKLASPLLFLVPAVGPLLVVVGSTVAGLAATLIWLVLIVKALQGERFKLPLLGEFAVEYAGESGA